MNQFYELVGITKQSHLSARQRRLDKEDKWELILAILTAERRNHPSMSLKKLYHKIRPDFVGRDAFVDFGMENGFEPILSAKKPQLTRSGELRSYKNLLHDLKIVGIDQVWVTDITYFKVKSKWCYISMIFDLYSRRIIGFKASKSLHTQASLDTLTMAIETRNITKNGFKIRHHSDRGSQYRSLDYTQKLDAHEILISMGHSCYDNVYMESGNRIIKNEYLIHRNIQSFDDLVYHLKKDVTLYNTDRPHGSLGQMNPVEFESYISNIPLSQRTPLTVFTSKFRKNNLLIINPDNQQLKLDFPKF